MRARVHHHAAVHLQPGHLRQRDVGQHADANHHQVSGNLAAIGANQRGDGRTGALACALHARHRKIRLQVHTGRAVHLLVKRGHGGASHARQHMRHGLQHGDFGAQLGGRRGQFQAHVAAANDDQAQAGLQRIANRVGVRERAQVVQVAGRIAIGQAVGHQRARAPTRANGELGVRQRAAIGQADGLRRRVDAADVHAQVQRDVGVLVGGRCAQVQRLAVGLAMQVGLGQRRPVIGQLVFFTQQANGARPPGLPGSQRQLGACVACTHHQQLALVCHAKSRNA